MKCPVCWSEKAYRRDAQSWTDALMECFLFVPFKCHHCFHKFYRHRFLTIGKEVRPPAPPKPVRRPSGMTQAQKHLAGSGIVSEKVTCCSESQALRGGNSGGE